MVMMGMTENKRFIDDGFEAIEEQSFTDNQTGKTYYVDYFDEIVDLLNALHEENQSLKNEIEKLSYANEDLLEEKRQWKKLSDEYAELHEENVRLKEEIKDFQDLLARKEEELLKPVIRMIDDRINKVDTISAETLKELRNEIME